MRQTFSDNKGQSLIGIVIVLVIVGLITGGLYYYLSKQIPEVPEITEMPAEEEIVKPEEEVVTPPPEEEVVPPKEEVPPEEVKPEVACKNECSPTGSKKCANNGYQICGNYDADACLEWSSAISCPQNTVCQNGNCIQQKCIDGTLYGQCSTNKPKYCDKGTLIDKASLCGCLSDYKISDNQCILDTSIKYKKVGIVYVSESNETRNASWRTDLYPNKSKIENALNDIFSKKGEKFVIDFLGEYRANNLCWNPNRIAFIQESAYYPGSIEKGWYTQIPGGQLCQGSCNYTCLPKYRTTLWSDCSQSRCEEYNNPDFPDSQCFRVKCDNKYFTLSLQNLSWIDPFLNELQSSVSFSNYDYKVIVLGKAGPIIPEIGEKEKHFFDTVAVSGEIMGYYAPSSKLIVMTENGLRIPSYYHYSGEAIWTKFFMPGWQQIVHEILHQFGAVDVYKPGYFQQNLNREEALKLEPESEVDKSIMANGWPGYCNDYQSTYSCTAQDTEKIYLDKFNRIKLGLE